MQPWLVWAIGNNSASTLKCFPTVCLPLLAKGVFSNRNKRKHPGKIVTTFAMGSQALYDFVDDNPEVVFLDVAYTNDTAVIRQNPQVMAINSALQVDLSGQVCADSLGTKIYSGVGGQMDFVRGAALSEGGTVRDCAASHSCRRYSVAHQLFIGARRWRGHHPRSCTLYCH